MKEGHRREGWVLGSLLISSGFLLFFHLWGRGLENHDYLRYAEVAREMVRSGDWIVPRLNGQIFMDKPPLLIWMIALPSRVHGSVTPFLARFPSALFACIGGVVVYLWSRKIWGDRRSGLISAAALVSSRFYFWQGRMARTDMVFSGLVLLSLYFFYMDYEEDRRSPRTILSFISMGLAGLTKGPVGILFPLLVISLFLFKERQWKRLLRREFLLGYLIIGLILGSWVISFLSRAGWDQTLQAWQETRILTRRAPFYLYGYRIWLDFVPWSVFVPSLFYHSWKKEERKTAEWFLWLWFLAIFLLLTFSPVRNARYLLPVFPALALLMGGFWRRRSLVPFGIIFLATLLAWHGYEYLSIQKNGIRSLGPFLVQELDPYQKGDILSYRMDVDLLAKINFYGDVTIPQMNQVEEIKKELRKGKARFILTTEKALPDLKEDLALTLLKRIDDEKKGFLLLRHS